MGIPVLSEILTSYKQDSNSEHVLMTKMACSGESNWSLRRSVKYLNQPVHYGVMRFGLKSPQTVLERVKFHVFFFFSFLWLRYLTDSVLAFPGLDYFFSYPLFYSLVLRVGTITTG